MKRTTSLTALLAVSVLASGAANASAAGSYVLSKVQYLNNFIVSYHLNQATYVIGPGTGYPGTCDGCGSTVAVDDGSGNVSVSDLTGAALLFTANNPANPAGQGGPYDWQLRGDIRTTVGNGVAINFYNTVANPTACTDIAGTVCQQETSGPGTLANALNSQWLNGYGADGTACPVGCKTSVVESGSGASAKIVITRQVDLSDLTDAGNYQSWSMTFTAIPVPGAVWLFGSALGLLGLRRKSA